ncbi:hypothetical protein [Ensifer sp. LCM 4579]|uniref:hypothetical protein n=1 Tax=Ensifer sp. LCM 4579 TaxID=1848292 RepID=UPI00155E2692|nr:hypothetical protein [Ensifer sp. LCM 4579]
MARPAKTRPVGPEMPGAHFVVGEYHYGDISQWKSMSIITDLRITGTITTMDM